MKTYKEMKTGGKIVSQAIMGVLTAPAILCGVILMHLVLFGNPKQKVPEIIMGAFIGYSVYLLFNIPIQKKNRKALHLFWLKYIASKRKIPLYINHKDEDIRQCVKERLGGYHEDT